MAAGFIKLWRALRQHELWSNGEPFSSGQAWTDILLRAAWKTHEVIYQHRAVTVDRGQIVTTERQLSRDWHRSRDWVRSVLDILRKTAAITTTNRPGVIVITVCNWDSYQAEYENVGQETAKDRPENGRASAGDRPRDKKVEEGEERKEGRGTPPSDLKPWDQMTEEEQWALSPKDPRHPLKDFVTPIRKGRTYDSE